MKYLVLLTLFVCPAFAQMCVPGAPYYCASTSTANPGNITAPFSASTPQNSVAEDFSIPGHVAGTEQITRITDPNSMPRGVGNGTCSGGDNDWMISAYGTYLGVVSGGAASIFHLSMATGPIQVVNAGKPPAVKVPCMMGFSRVNDSRLYYVTGSVIHQVDITSDTTSTDTVLVDLMSPGVCPGVTPFNVAGTGILGISDDDDKFSGSFNPGTQGSGDWSWVWSRTKGCYPANWNTGNTYDPNGLVGTFPTGATNCWGSNGAAGNGIHDTQLSGDGLYQVVSHSGAWTQGGCAGIAGSQTPASYWQVGTTGNQNCGNRNIGPLINLGCGSHGSVGVSNTLIPGSNNSPTYGPTVRANSNISTFTVFFPKLGIYDTHCSWPHDDNGTSDDNMPWVCAGDSTLLTEGTVGVNGCTSAVYCPEFKAASIWAIFSNKPGVIKSFTHTFECGWPGSIFAQCSDGISDPFGPAAAIGVVSPRGNYFCWVSTMLHQLENKRADEFCVVLQ